VLLSFAGSAGLVVVLLFAAIAPGSFWVLYLAISLVQWVSTSRGASVEQREFIVQRDVLHI